MAPPRIFAAAIVAAATTFALIVPPAGAEPQEVGAPDSGLRIHKPGLAWRTTSAATPTCVQGVPGVTGGQKLIYRRLRNLSLASPDYLASSALPFNVASSAYKTGRSTEGGSETELITLNGDGRPRVVTMILTGDTSQLSWRSKLLLNRGFQHRLIASVGGYYYFMVDKQGTLRRWTMYRNDRDQLYFANGKIVARGMGGLRTLTGYTKPKLGGVRTAILFGSTRSGALLQIRVGDTNPNTSHEPVGRVRVITIKKRGFARYTNLSPGSCNRNPDFASFTAIDRKANIAHLYTLKQVSAPRASNLVFRGRVARNAHWRIRATW